MTGSRKKPKSDPEALKQAVIDAALGHIAFDGFSDALMKRAGKEAGADAENWRSSFPRARCRFWRLIPTASMPKWKNAWQR